MIVKNYSAVMKIKNHTDHKRVVPLAKTVHHSQTINVITYPNPNPTMAELETQIGIVEGLVNDVSSGDHSKIGLRDEACIVLFNMLKFGLIYVNITAAGDRGKLELSGYEINADAAPRPVPEQVNIKSIVGGVHTGTAKINVHRVGQVNLTFIVQMTTTPDVEDSWKNVLIIENSRELIVGGLVPGQEYWFRVCARNPQGNGLWSSPRSFFLQR